jgi:hypothetical protein
MKFAGAAAFTSGIHTRLLLQPHVVLPMPQAAAKSAADQATRQLRNFRSSLCSTEDETARMLGEGQQQVYESLGC